MSALWDGAATFWRPSADGESFERSTLSGVRCEVRREQAASDAGPVWRDALGVFVPGEADVRPGDWCAAGARPEADPPADAHRVVSVAPFTLRGRAHHTEVTAS